MTAYFSLAQVSSRRCVLAHLCPVGLGVRVPLHENGQRRCTKYPHNHKSGGTVPKTLGQIRAGSFFADGVELFAYAVCLP